MAAAPTWTKLPDAPFGYEWCGRPAVLINDEIILSPKKDNHIYKFNIKSQSWTKYSFGEYKNIEYHAICTSNDKKTLFLFDGYKNKILLIIDIESMKVIKKMDNMIATGMYPVIMADPYNNKLLHIIGGYSNNKHICVNIENGKTNILYEFKTNERLEGGVIINNKNILLFIHGRIPMHSFDLKTRKWTNLNVNIPKHEQFGSIQTLNNKYVLLFGGYHCETSELIDDILIYDIEARKYKISTTKSPMRGPINTVITKDGEIHLFFYNRHYKTSINNILNASELNKAKNEFLSEEKEEKKEEEKEKERGKEEEKKEEKGIHFVREWLTKTVGLGQYFNNFIEDGYDDIITITKSINEQDLIDMAIHKKGHRKKILIFIQKYNDQHANAADNVADYDEYAQIEGSNDKHAVAPNLKDTAK